MTTEEILNIINNSNIRTLNEFSNKCYTLLPELIDKTIIHKKDMGVSGILAIMRCYNRIDEILIRGFLYLPDNWSEETHGYIKAKKI